MKVTMEETSPREVKLNIELESADVEPYLDKAYKRVVNKIQIPGFRPGKAPRWRVEQVAGREALVRESLDSIAQESLEKAIKQENLEAFGEPEVELVEIDPLSFKAVVSLEPVVDLGAFRSLRLEPEPFEVTEEQVDSVLERMQYDAAPWEPVDRPVKFGDLLNIDLDGTVEGNKVADEKGVDFIPRQDNPLPFPGFSVYLEGMNKEESKEFTLDVPEDYSDNSIAGKECRFKVKVLETKEKVLSELDDEFAKGVGTGYESLEALRTGVLTDLTERAQSLTQRAFQEKSLEEVIKGAAVEVSELTTNKEIDHLLEEQEQALQARRMDMDTYLQNAGKTREELREELRPTAEERLTRFLVIRRLAREEAIEVSSDEIDGEVESLTSGASESGDSLRQALSSERARSSIGSSILTRKVLERLAQIVEGSDAEEETPQEVPASAQDAQEHVEVEGADESALAPSGHAGAGQSQEEGGGPSDDEPV